RPFTLVAVVLSVLLSSVAVADGCRAQRHLHFRRILLPTLGGTFTHPQAVNDRNQVAGQADTATGAELAFFWEGGALRSLGTLGGSFSAALAINNRAQVVGFASTPADAAMHGFVWQRGKMTDLGPLPGGTDSGAQGINDRGVVVGFSNAADNIVRAV